MVMFLSKLGSSPILSVVLFPFIPFLVVMFVWLSLHMFLSYVQHMELLGPDFFWTIGYRCIILIHSFLSSSCPLYLVAGVSSVTGDTPLGLGISSPIQCRVFTLIKDSQPCLFTFHYHYLPRKYFLSKEGKDERILLKVLPAHNGSTSRIFKILLNHQYYLWEIWGHFVSEDVSIMAVGFSSLFAWLLLIDTF